MTGPTFIDCDRIVLRPAEAEDVLFLREGVNHPEVRQYISSFRTPYTEQRYREELWPVEHQSDGVSLLAVPTEGEFADEPVGSVQLHPLKDADGYANFGVWFHPDAWGNGYALEASAHLIDYGFRELRLHRVSATTVARNRDARTLCERLGFVHEGTARQSQFADGEYLDCERYALLIDDWNGVESVLDYSAQKCDSVTGDQRTTTVIESIGAEDTETVVSGHGDWFGADLAERLSRHPLEAIEREFPHHGRSVDSPDGNERPKERHPVFFGCFDWHSAVHSHWNLVRQLRLFDDHPARVEILRRIDARLTPANVDQEVERFEAGRSFEKPYGWAWFLRLASELHLWDGDRADRWRDVLRPLEDQIVTLVRSEFLSQERPFRVGTHQNSAFALQCVLDYARTVSDGSLESAALDTSRRFFEGDRNYPVRYEPLGWDFLSPSLTEADLMRRVLDRDEFRSWLDSFLPNVTTPPHDSIMDPVQVQPDPDEGIALHLVGLNLSKAWSMAGIASALGDHRYAEAFDRSAGRHAERGLEMAFTDEYTGAHWLSTFVLYLLTRNEGGIAPA